MRKSDFEKLYRDRYESVHTFFLRRGYSSEDSHDLSQETFLRVYQYRQGVQKPEAFLSTAAASVWKNDIRSRRALKRRGTVLPLGTPGDRETGAISNQVADPAPGPLPEARGSQLAEHLSRAIRELPDRMRACLLLRVGQSLSYTEVAVVMQISVGTVKSQLHEARKRLTDRLGDVYGSINFDRGARRE